MTGVIGEGAGFRNLNSIADLKKSGDSSIYNSSFDASQYAFFGSKKVVEDVELGGLEDDEVVNNAGLEWLGDTEFPISFTNNEEREEGEILESLSDIDDLTSTFAKLNRVVGEPRSAGVIGDRGSFSRESSSTLDWTQEADISENVEDNKRWWSQPYAHATNFSESKPLHRTSSYPEPLPQHPPCESIVNSPYSPNSSFNSHPTPIGTRPQLLSRHSSLPFSPHSSVFSPYDGNIPSNISINNRNQNQFFNQGGSFTVENTNIYPNMLQQQFSLPNGWENPSLLPNVLHQQLSLPNGLLTSQLLSQQKFLQAQHFSHLQSRFFSSHPSPPTMNKFDLHRGNKSSLKARQSTRFSHHNSDTSSQKHDSMVPQFRSKYMSSEEITTILKIQHATAHNSDPYTHDYYHQACLVKKASINKPKHQFYPSKIQVDALSPIRRPSPLLQPDPVPTSLEKPLEQEPMLAARIAIEDGLCLLLAIDDIDRLLHSGQSQTQDGGTQLRRRRQALLEGLAASLQLVDPFNHSVGLGPKDDLIFLRLTSLPKGRKLLSRFLQLIYPGNELTRIVSMAVFRHLRFLFGGPPSDSSTTLSQTVSTCVRTMELSALSACLAATVCSSEQPPLRPLGSSSGDGASVIIKSLLERATELVLVPPKAAFANYAAPDLSLWRASFDAFFALLTKYCLSKYDSILQNLIGSDVSKAVAREMPIELLRASIPHTNDVQRRQLLDFAQRSMPAAEYSGNGSRNGSLTSESVLG